MANKYNVRFTTSSFLINNPLKITAMKVQVLNDLLYLLTAFFFSIKISTFRATIYLKGVIDKTEACSKSNSMALPLDELFN